LLETGAKIRNAAIQRINAAIASKKLKVADIKYPNA